MCESCFSEDEYMRTCDECGETDQVTVRTSRITGEASFYCSRCNNQWF